MARFQVEKASENAPCLLSIPNRCEAWRKQRIWGVFGANHRLKDAFQCQMVLAERGLNASEAPGFEGLRPFFGLYCYTIGVWEDRSEVFLLIRA